MDGDTLSWEDGRGAEGSFHFQTTGIDRVWMTCEARSSGNFCHQINFKIVKGDLYRFQDSRRESGSNTAVLNVMEALRTHFPRLAIGGHRRSTADLVKRPQTNCKPKEGVMSISIPALLILIVIAAVCGAIGKAIAGDVRGGLIVSIVLGFIGALLGPWVAGLLKLPEPFMVTIGGHPFPILWSIIGAALFIAVIHLFSRR